VVGGDVLGKTALAHHGFRRLPVKPLAHERSNGDGAEKRQRPRERSAKEPAC
jgi:hypothetical protein